MTCAVSPVSYVTSQHEIEGSGFIREVHRDRHTHWMTFVWYTKQYTYREELIVGERGWDVKQHWEAQTWHWLVLQAGILAVWMHSG